MTTKKSNLLKPKTTAKTSHNSELQALVDAVQKVADVPFQVRLSETLAKRVKVYAANNGLNHKQIVTEALEAYLAK
jgi:predicted DNA binding CopG/RHH family protein